jgi:nucleoside-diphosphate-sugar epimerase
MNSILVTGGAGYVGSILVRRLINEGYQVVCVDKLFFGGDSLLDIWGNPSFDFHNCDITIKNEIDKIIDSYSLSGIIHLAAIVGDPACKLDPELAERTNWDASVHLLEKSIDAKIPRFIFASTCSNYGKMNDSTQYVNENSPLAPVSLYAQLKVKFEDLMLDQIKRNSVFCPTSLRFATVYGLSHRMRFDLTVNEFAKELSQKRELVIFGEQFWRPYCHVIDFSNAIMKALESAKEKVAYKVFNVGSTEENYTKQMIVDEIVKQIPGCKIKYIKKNEDPRDYRVDFSRIKNELGFGITKTVPEGIKEIKNILESGIISDPENQKYYNIPRGK